MLLGAGNMEKRVLDGLIKRGLPPHIAQGFTANMIAESGLKPGINEIAPVVPGSRGGFGLNQWTGPRRRAYETFAQQRGSALDDLDAQLDFTISELQGPESRAWEAIQGARDPVEAARLVSEKFLRPGVPNMDKRLKEAARLGGMPGSADIQGGGGLLSMIGGEGNDMVQNDAPRGFLDRTFKDQDWRQRAAIALEGMTLNPNQGLISMLGGDIKDRGDSKKADASKNKTLEWLQKIGTPAAMKAYEYAQATGDIVGAAQMAMQTAPQAKPIEVGGVLLNPNTYETIFDSRTEKDPIAALRVRAQEAGLKPGTPEYESFMAAGGAPEGAGGTTVNIDNKSESEFAKQFAKGDADTLRSVYDAGLQATRNIGRIDQLGSLLEKVPTGATAAIKQFAGEFGINTEGLDDLQSAQALINSLVPEQRQPGSGPMSDADLALFKQSLPRLINQPGGNAMIVQTMRAIAQYDAEGAAIVQQMREDVIDNAKAFKMLQERQNPLSEFKGQAGGAPSGGTVRRKFNPATRTLE